MSGETKTLASLIASQAEAEAGTDNVNLMTALRTAQAIAALAAGGGAVDSVFSRTGDVVAAAGDYAASELTNDSSVTGDNVDDALDALQTAIDAANAGVRPDSQIYFNDFYAPAATPGSSLAPEDLADPDTDLPYATIGAYIAHVYANGRCPAAATDAGYDSANSWSGYTPALDDPCDHIAVMIGLNYAYDRGEATTNSNWSSATFVVDELYQVKNLVCNLHAARFVGTRPNNRYAIHTFPGSPTGFRYIGDNGTLDALLPIIDCYSEDESDAAPPGRETNNVSFPKYVFEHIAFRGKTGTLSSSDQSAGHGYNIGARIRPGSFVQFNNCGFNGLYDGVVFSGVQLFVIIDRCFFGSCARDGVANWRGEPNNNSTTIWIYNNEFIGCGRYSILLDLVGGAVEQKPIIRDNSFEHTNTGFYPQHPEWCVHGVVASTCIMSGNDMIFDANRYEGFEDDYYYADLHIVDCGNAKITNNNVHNLIVSSVKASDYTSAAFDSYYSANRFSDITDTRNYNVGGSSGAGRNNNEGLVIEHNTHLNTIFYPDGTGTAVTTANAVRDQVLTPVSVPTYAGTYAQLVTPRSTAFPTLMASIGAQVVHNTASYTQSGGRVFRANGSYKWASMALGTAWGPGKPYAKATASGSWIRYSLRKPATPNGFCYICSTPGISNDTEPTWGTTIGGTTADNAGSPVSPTTWASDTDYSVGDYVEPATPAGYIYYCAVAGASGATEPTFGTTTGGTTDDNNFAVWQAIHTYSLGEKVTRTIGSTNFYFEVTTPGDSGGTEPTWVNTAGETTADGTAVWTCRDQINWVAYPDDYPGAAVWICAGRDVLASMVNSTEQLFGGQRHRWGTSWPSGDRVAVGDTLHLSDPVSAGYERQIVGTAGVVGTSAVWGNFSAVIP